MRRMHKQPIEDVLAREVPVLVLDQDGIVIQANLLLLWCFGTLRIGEPCDPGHLIGHHEYEVLARSIETGRFALEDPGNRGFIVGRLRAVLGKPEEHLSPVRHFLARVDASVESRRWREATMAALDGHGEALAFDEDHASVVLHQPDGSRLHVQETVERQDDGRRLITYEPWEQDGAIRDVMVAAHDQLTTIYPHVDYVHDVRQLTAFFPRKRHNAPATSNSMSPERELLPRSERAPADEAGRPSSGGAASTTSEWRPTQVFPRNELDQAIGRQAEPVAEHPVFGAGFAWELAGGGGEPTRLEIFPDRRWASVRYLDGSLQPQHRGLILDYLAIRSADPEPVVSLVSAREGRATLINVYPSGEVDEFFRFYPAWRSVSPEALVFTAPAAAPPTGPAPREQPALPVVEAARQLGTGPERVRVLLRAGDLEGFKRGGTWYVPTDALAEFQALRRQQTLPATSKEQVATYHQTYYAQKKQDPEWLERRRAQAREAMRRKREREREAS